MRTTNILTLFLVFVFCVGLVSAQGFGANNDYGVQNKDAYQNQNRIMGCSNEDFCSYNESMVGNSTIVRERITARFLFWDVDAETSYELDENNEIVGHNNNFWRFLYNNNIIKQRGN